MILSVGQISLERSTCRKTLSIMLSHKPSLSLCITAREDGKVIPLKLLLAVVSSSRADNVTTRGRLLDG